MIGHSAIRLEGMVGVDWEALRSGVDCQLRLRNVNANWVPLQSAMNSPEQIETLISPFLGGTDPLFGTRFTGELSDFFNQTRLQSIVSRDGGLTLYYGTGAGLVDCDGPLVFVDVPKNEIQYRSRAGKYLNLGATQPSDKKSQYKRMYFVDWVAINKHIAEIADDISLFVDGRQADLPVLVERDTFDGALDHMSRSVFRVQPWFEAGPWGGQWIKRQLGIGPADIANFAWSFEFIAPENGLKLSDGDATLEVAFDWLMVRHSEQVLGECASWFGREFPIRFDFLDTIEGGNLSLQCHPRPEYIREKFGEVFTQDETYYILDCEPEAEVYLGFHEGIDAVKFRSELERSAQDNSPVDVKAFVQALPASRHDLFLIPHGTVHCSGEGSMVLEISATPYIFTFKMYDWLRADLDGKPRPLNIERAFRNLNFDRRGEKVEQELVSRPVEIASGADWSLQHLPTHKDHFYDIHRVEFDTSVDVQTDGSPHVLMLVEGTSVTIDVSGMQRTFNYAETFVVPAAAESYRLINRGEGRAKVVKALMKPSSRWPEWMHAGLKGSNAEPS
jgi:mannose-6-phosphate isomerase class I